MNTKCEDINMDKMKKKKIVLKKKERCRGKIGISEKLVETNGKIIRWY